MTTIFDENLLLGQLPTIVYMDLVDELNRDSNWKMIACHLGEKLGYDCDSWLQSLQRNTSSSMTPSYNLLSELNTRMCTVGTLCALLHDCNLYSVLSILYELEPLTIIRHPSDNINSDILEVSLGRSLTLSCQATGIPPPSYKWYHNDIEIQEQEQSLFSMHVNSSDQAGEYKCKISQVNNDKTVISVLWTRPVFVNISPTSIVIQQQPLALLEVKEGQDFTISCIANSHPEPRYQWFRGNMKLDGETSNVLHVKHFSSKYEGKYYCYITNEVSEMVTQKSHVMLDLPRQKAIAKVALIIANSDYENHKCLETPKNDGAKIGKMLKEIGFKVICLANLSFEQMRNAIKIFSEVLVEGIYGLFYYAGHGFKMQESYMLAVDAPVSYLRKDAICESELLSILLQKDPALLVTILDMCQTVPPKECNPDIHNEIPRVEEYKSTKNLRNLVQAYSTSSNRPSYERVNSRYGLYVTHLSKFIIKDIPVTKVFEEVGKSIDACLKGTERNQIPIFALTITKPFRLTDAIYNRNPLSMLNDLNKLITFSDSSFEISFKQANISATVNISLFMEPYLNIIKVSICTLKDFDVNYFNSVPTKRNNLFQNRLTKECWIYNPQICQGPLVVSLSRDGPIGATLLHVKNHIPQILKNIGK